jgi:hypothetical protein
VSLCRVLSRGWGTETGGNRAVARDSPPFCARRFRIPSPAPEIAEIESLIDAGELRGARLGSRYLVCPFALAQFLKPMAVHAARASNVTRLGRSLT